MLIAASYSGSRLNTFTGAMRRFMEFCEYDGVPWDRDGRHTVVAYLAHLYATILVTREKAAQYRQLAVVLRCKGLHPRAAQWTPLASI